MPNIRDVTGDTNRRTVGAARSLSALLLLSGCASIVSGASQPITITSAPDQAAITIKDENGVEVFRGTTPTTVTLKKSGGYFNGRDYTVTYAKEGFAPQTAMISSRPNGWYILGNLIFGGLIGWLIVDPATGAMWTLAPDTLNVGLSRAPTPFRLNPPTSAPLPDDKLNGQVSLSDPEPGLRVATLDSLSPEIRQKLVPLP